MYKSIYVIRNLQRHRSVSTTEQSDIFVCLFVLRLNIPVNNFSVMSGWSHLFLDVTSTLGE